MKPLLAATLALTLVAPAFPQATVNELQKLFPPGGAFLDSFGRDVAVLGDTAVVGAHGDDGKGSVAVLKRVAGSWTPAGKLSVAGGNPGDSFGWRVELLEDVLYVAATGTDGGATNSGSVYRFDRVGDSFVPAGQLQSPDPGDFGAFGFDMDAAADLLVVGAPDQAEVQVLAGAVYVFRKVGASLVLEQKLTAPVPSLASEFGFAVATDGQRIVVGSVGEDAVANDAGAAFVYAWNGSSWQLEDSLFAADGGDSDYFGAALDIDGDQLVVGAYNHDLPTVGAGAVYVYGLQGGQWSADAKLGTLTGFNNEAFGWSVELDGPRLMIGATGHFSGAGGVFQYHHDGNQWVQVHRWLAADPFAGGGLKPGLGFCLALDGETLFAGAPFAGGAVSNSGAAFVFEATDLALDALPDDVVGGQVLELRTHGGLAGAPMGLALTGVSGLPFFDVLYLGSFDPAGQVSFLPVVPPALVGLELDFLAGGFWNPAELGFSNTVTVTVL
ncbi:FG-GAP repeat protein [Engelhardtia mirabilis]|uniref:FG-GAP repeat protein n=1 Tax=Engelhardtia mirabilis TaxID=2528011 RepID=A0A518BDZ2_9BACT|nr:hypothetical protein Pla133_02720 [Planctomycetes bacterium Pla133]QDU99534.1 hypothetical protein Pla86_02720 [Planctomycetes bacterium Pla86]